MSCRLDTDLAVGWSHTNVSSSQRDGNRQTPTQCSPNELAASIVQVRGVTFNNDATSEARQDILDRLRKSAQSSSGTGLPVLLMREPDNPNDPEAVAVMSSLVCDGRCSCPLTMGGPWA